MQNSQYHQPRAANTAAYLCLALLVGSCSVRDVSPFQGGWDVNEQALESWTPAGADPQAEPGLLWTSRMWAVPNPVLLPVPDTPDGVDLCATIDVWSIGVDPLTITGVRYEGAPLTLNGFHEFRWPNTLSDGQDAGSNGFGTMVCAAPDTQSGPVGEIIFDTDDPTAPEVRLEVRARPRSEIPYDPGVTPHIFYHARLHMGPNPVRLTHAAGPTEITVTAIRVGEEPLNLLGVDTLGPDVTVTGIEIDGVPGWDGLYPVVLPEFLPGSSSVPVRVYVRLRYDPTDAKPHDDALILAFDDGGLESYRVVVPIVVR